MSAIVVYTTRFCPYCTRAKSLFDDKGVVYREIAIDNKPQLRQEMMANSGRRTVPQIWIGDRHIGGCDDLMVLERSGKLDGLLEKIA